MSTQESPLSAFFSSYDFSRYTYDPANTPADEFERLCTARQWGKAKKDENYAKFLLASSRETRKPLVVAFFRKYEFSHFTYNPLADPAAEFDRLQEARKWGKGNLKKIRKEFQAALGGDGVEAAVPTASEKIIPEKLPIVEFLKGHEFPGYTYRSGRPEAEFKRLCQAHRRIWEANEREEGGVIWEVELRKEKGVITEEEIWNFWKETDTFEDLNGFYKAVENQFDLTLRKIAGKTGLQNHEVMVELYCVGKAPMARLDAEIALRSVHVNIYDFLELVAATINNATVYERQNLILLLSPGARALNFPNDAMLAIYSKAMGRVFPRECANSKGTLILLLRLIKQYFGSFGKVFERFTNEAEKGVVNRARQEGPDAMRKLLLSREWVSLRGIRAMPNTLPENLRRFRGRRGPQ